MASDPQNQKPWEWAPEFAFQQALKVIPMHAQI